MLGAELLYWGIMGSCSRGRMESAVNGTGHFETIKNEKEDICGQQLAE